MKKVVLFLVVVFLMILSTGQNDVKAFLSAPCPMGYAIFEHNIFGGGRFTVLRCDCAYEDCKGWDQQCQAGGVLI